LGTPKRASAALETAVLHLWKAGGGRLQGARFVSVTNGCEYVTDKQIGREVS